MYIRAELLNVGNELKVGANFYQIEQVKHDADRAVIVFKNQKGEMKVIAKKAAEIVNVRG